MEIAVNVGTVAEDNLFFHFVQTMAELIRIPVVSCVFLGKKTVG